MVFIVTLLSVSALALAGCFVRHRDRLHALGRDELEKGVLNLRVEVPVAEEGGDAQLVRRVLVGDDVLAGPGLLAFGNPDLEVDTGAAEQQVLALDAADLVYRGAYRLMLQDALPTTVASDTSCNINL
jgi:hypothetical protein